MIIPRLEFVFVTEGKLAPAIQIGSTYEGPQASTWQTIVDSTPS